MKRKKPQGSASILFETDMECSSSLDETKLTELQKHCLTTLPTEAQKNIIAGQGAAIVDLEDGSRICDFNMESYQLPKDAIEKFARALLPHAQEFFSNKENQKKFEEWEKEQGNKDKEKIA